MTDDNTSLLQKILDAVGSQSVWPKLLELEKRVTAIEAGFRQFERIFEKIPDQITDIGKSVAVMVANMKRLDASVERIEENTRTSDQTINQQTGATASTRTILPWFLSVLFVVTTTLVTILLWVAKKG